MKKLYTLLLIGFSCLTYGQINFEPGYFIDNGGNKTNCLIKNVAWRNNPVDFEYKMTENDETKTAGIKTVKEFCVNNAYKFKRFDLKIEKSFEMISRLDTSPEPKWENETLFLKVLVEGDLTLYQFEDGNIIKYFYSSPNSEEATQLLYKKFDNKGIISENSHYKQQLYNLMSNRLTESSDFQNLKYKKSYLVKLFTQYNGNSNKDYEVKHNSGKLNLKVTAGASVASLSLSNSNTYSNTINYDFDSKTVFSFGAEIEYVLPFNNKKWSVFINPVYSTYKNSTQQNEGATVEYNYLQIPVGVRHYMFINDESKIFINAAFAFCTNSGSVKHGANNRELELGSANSFIVGAGYSYKKYSAEIRYNIQHSILTNYTFWDCDYSTIGIMLGYRFL
ncbi:hypothetical protein [Flavobacterium sp.]|uniref:hypothetical protein n=1 Tax=Flavobacterium sp. TaxID=239 RepID=UPI003A9326EA